LTVQAVFRHSSAERDPADRDHLQQPLYWVVVGMVAVPVDGTMVRQLLQMQLAAWGVRQLAAQRIGHERSGAVPNELVHRW
jgi:hypothetical protein